MKPQQHPSKTLAHIFVMPCLMALCFMATRSTSHAAPDHGSIESRIAKLHDQFLENRRAAIPDIICPFDTPALAVIVDDTPKTWKNPVDQWRRGITATVFWVGEKASERNPTPNNASSWDPHWQSNYGGVDSPSNRSGHNPAGFTPKLTPFYIALPYNDIAPGGEHQPEASEVIPWYWKTYKGAWSSVCKGRWVAIHYRGKVCYAQWEDCGPFSTDDWKYVFKGHSPKPNPNGNAGIDISPAIRDFLQIRSGYRVAWKFVELQDVPAGPWTSWMNTSR